MRLRVSFRSGRMKKVHGSIVFFFMLVLLCDCKNTVDNSLNEEALSNLRIHSCLFSV